MNMKSYRQGDVRLKEIAEMPKGLSKKDNILAHSESGHNHIIENAVVYADASGQQYVQVQQEAQLTHQKDVEAHEQITIPKGIYRVVHQREFSPQEERRVMD
jgi:allophanate hydrolase subunit 1